MTRDEIYLAALLHDIGKFTKRTKRKKVENRFSHVSVHAKYSAQLMDNLCKKESYLTDYSKDIVDTILYHHQPYTELQELVQLADWLSMAEREDDKDNTEMDFSSPLKSIFSELFVKQDESEIDYFYPLEPLSKENIFPKTDRGRFSNNYKESADKFYKELGKVYDETQLYYLLKKHLWSVPAQTWKHVPDISLFDHSKTTAAIALCLYDQYKAGELTTSDLKEKYDSNKEQFMLINADISGIQDFIFSVPSKGASKSLKGRSAYISLLSDVVAKYILDELELKEANLLYNGRDNFYILAPVCKREKLKAAEEQISNNILAAHSGHIYIAIDHKAFAPYDFGDFTKLWGEVKQQVKQLKYKKWSELGLIDNYDQIFGPLDQGTSEINYCKVCGVSGEERRLSFKENEVEICSLCKSFIDLTDDLKDANYYCIESVNYQEEIEDYNDVLGSFGYEIDFSPGPVSSQQGEVYKLNSTDFLDDRCAGYKFGAYNVPMEDGQQIDFEGLAKKSIYQPQGAEQKFGDEKLGFLKLNVDNLDLVFSQGLQENRSISRIVALNKMFSFYFEGYINQLITTEGWEDKLYTVFSGGSNLFILGAWNAVFEFANHFYNKFREYTCNNNQITFSAGLNIYRPKYPVIRAANLTERALEEAKHSKNKVSLFGEVFNWVELDLIKEIKDFLVELIIKEENSRSLLYKVRKSTLGFKKILSESIEGGVHNLKFWRLAYYLQDIEKKDADKLIDYYRKIVINNLLGKSNEETIRNIMIIPAAVRWAELETKKAT